MSRIPYESKYQELYPRVESIDLVDLRPLADRPGIEIVLEPLIPDFSHFSYYFYWNKCEGPLYSFPRELPDGAEEHKSYDGRITIPLEASGEPRPDFYIFQVCAISKSGLEAPPYELRLQYIPSEYYSQHGNQQKSRVNIRETNLRTSAHSIYSFMSSYPTDVDQKFAQAEWGHLIAPGATDYENAKILLKVLTDTLLPHRGCPTDELDKLTPFDQYRKLIAGEDRCWCSHTAKIFQHACACFGIPAREIRTAGDMKQGYVDTHLVFQHATTEIFCRHSQQWIWMDMQHHLLGVFLGEEGPLNIAEMHLAINNPARYSRLRLHSWDAKEKIESWRLLSESIDQYAFLHYFDTAKHLRFSIAPDTTKASAVFVAGMPRSI